MGKGFTLIELIIVVVISSMVSVVTFSFVYNSIQAYRLMRTQGQLYRDGTYALERITRDLRDASSGVNAGIDIYFLKPARTALQAPNVVDRNAFVRYYRVGTNLFRCSDSTTGSVCLSNPSASSTNKLVSRKVVNFTATTNPNTPCNLSNPLTCQDDSFTVKLDLANDGQSITLTATITPKNYCAGGASAASCSTQDYSNRSFNGDYRDVAN